MIKSEIHREAIRRNLDGVRERIARAAIRSGRTPEAVRLVAVTKYVDISTAALLVEAGCMDLGESRPQELWDKSAAFAYRGVHVHLIGHLQRNKVAKTIAATDWIHSGDSERLLDSINAAAEKKPAPVSVLLEVNITSDESKTGMKPVELLQLVPLLKRYSNIRICGLMAMSGLHSDTNACRDEFRRVRLLRDELQNQCPTGIELAELSMGMSDDFEIAIEEGATIVRIGSALFEGCDN